MANEQIQERSQQARRAAPLHQGNGHQSGDASATATDNAAATMIKASEIQKESAEFTADRLRTLASAYVSYAHGMQSMQRAFVDLCHRSFELTQRTTRELIRCTSASDVAELQREMLCEGMDEFFEGSAKILKAASKATDDAVRPLEEKIDPRRRNGYREGAGAAA